MHQTLTTDQPRSQLSLLSEPGAIRIEAVADGEPSSDGKPRLPRFSMVAYTGGPMRIAGWRYPVIVDLAGLAIPSQSRPIRFGHDMASGVGHTDAIKIEDGRLVATGVVSRDTAAAREIVASARNGFPWQASIGSSVEEFEFVKQNQKVIVNGREFSGPLNVVRKATLGEISFVDLGADGNTSASVAAGFHSQQEENMDSQENVNHQEAIGDAAPDGAVTQPTATVQAAATQEHQAAPTAAEIRAEAAAESKRIAVIRGCFAGRHPQLEAQAIEDNWDVARCERELKLADLRDGRPKAPALQFRSEPVTGRTLEAACMLTAKATAVETMFDEPTLDAAQRRF
ncbi:MAG: hypothetical protein KJZ87_13525, partial [Thermoguttaceae bacterium]|nr:hypothetical protein [Thermoguttaceae bacterium]